MGRKLRYVPPGGALVEVTTRTLQGRLLLRPDAALNELVVGVLARARERYPVRIHALVFLSNHYHLLLSVESAKRLSKFMGYVNSNLAREVGRLRRWREKLWGRRYQGICISEEEQSQVARLAYVLSHGCKESLVAEPGQWPGVHSVAALTCGEALKGRWYDRTKEYEARRAGKEPSRWEFATSYTLELDPLPCWAQLPEEDYRRQVQELVDRIVEETAARHRAEGTEPVGARWVRRQRPHHLPAKLKRSPAPLVHAASKDARRKFRNAYAWFVLEYRRAAARLAAGKVDVAFPQGSFPPPLPYVAEPRPG
jgi:putative transposase